MADLAQVVPLDAHPAKFGDRILDAIDELITTETGVAPRGTARQAGKGARRRLRVLDPFAGVGRIHELGFDSVGIEIEPRWAAAHPRNRLGDATALAFPDGAFDVVATSPCYGNRMADQQEPRERCRMCRGLGVVDPLPLGEMSAAALDAGAPNEGTRCPRCEGKGRNAYERNTYRHVLDAPPAHGSAAGMQWGPAYRRLHEHAWEEAWRVLRPGGLFILNVKNHLRTLTKGGPQEEQHVAEWHLVTLAGLGLVEARRIVVPVRGNRQGQNGDARIDHELVVALRKP